jgi:hypothetical protein
MSMIQRYRQTRAVAIRKRHHSQLQVLIAQSIKGTKLAKQLTDVIQSDALYKIEGAKHIVFNLHKNADGSYFAFARDATGKIIGNARLRPALSVGRAAKMGAAAIAYVAMHEIASELRAAQKRLANIERKLESAADADFQQALAYAIEALDRRDMLALQLGELPLRRSLAAQILELNHELDTIPDLRSGLLIRVGVLGDGSDAIREDLLARETRLHAVFSGIQILLHLKTLIHGTEMARRSLASLPMQQLAHSLAHAHEKAKLIETSTPTQDPSGPPHNIYSEVWRKAQLLTEFACAGTLNKNQIDFGAAATLLTIPAECIMRELAPNNTKTTAEAA